MNIDKLSKDIEIKNLLNEIIPAISEEIIKIYNLKFIFRDKNILKRSDYYKCVISSPLLYPILTLFLGLIIFYFLYINSNNKQFEILDFISLFCVAPFSFSLMTEILLFVEKITWYYYKKDKIELNFVLKYKNFDKLDKIIKLLKIKDMLIYKDGEDKHVNLIKNYKFNNDVYNQLKEIVIKYNNDFTHKSNIDFFGYKIYCKLSENKNAIEEIEDKLTNNKNYIVENNKIRLLGLICPW